MTEQTARKRQSPSLAASVSAGTAPWSWLRRERLEAILVVVTLLAIAASLVAERLAAPAWLILLANITSYVAGGWFGVQAGVKSLFKREVNVDLLMVLAAIGAAIVDQWHEGATLLFLFSLSNVLQAYAMDRSRHAIRALLKLRPNQATLRREGELVVVPVEALQIGDVVVIRPGERFPIDGKVADGESTVDQSPITGESMPVAKARGDDVFAGTVNQNGSLDVRVTRAAGDTTLARIIRMVEEAQGQKAHTQRFLDEFEQKYALFVIVSVLLFIVIPPLLPGGPAFGDNFYRAMVLMTVASPCALIISTPASMLSAIANAAHRGILFKGGVHLDKWPHQPSPVRPHHHYQQTGCDRHSASGPKSPTNGSSAPPPPSRRAPSTPLPRPSSGEPEPKGCPSSSRSASKPSLAWASAPSSMVTGCWPGRSA
jgi:Cd2+/Zn2+-exporting ATPase